MIIRACVGIPMIRTILGEVLTNNFFKNRMSNKLDNRASPKDPRKIIREANFTIIPKLIWGDPNNSSSYNSVKITLL
tara:strand:- start:331 stop:561 length:231 start_codon:yes stop_codon:yes gene_type:complete